MDVHESSVYYATYNFLGWTNLKFRALFQDTYVLPVAVDNDVNASLLGERWLGADRNYQLY
ncbi:MAG: hypothetical protein BSOLF_1693 [Candidatus Carbobacillus altaicus]|uniref:Uncharacterized protein n=1 Tax=Candidatus Carbonibacillus altaicus TaxID=2163959 RepID=A0A2R6Y3X1_9BACL|nr:MAG: hypothetical protein BSOLF_1693 [Candidatus Carbobacillus altaicus]